MLIQRIEQTLVIAVREATSVELRLSVILMVHLAWLDGSELAGASRFKFLM